MSTVKPREDEIILSLLEARRLEDFSESPSRFEGEDESTLVRLYTEVLGLTALVSEPLAPRPGLRVSILAGSVRGPGAERNVEPPVSPEVPKLRPEPVAPWKPPRPARTGSRWVLPLAASLAVLAASGAAVRYSQQAEDAESRVATLSEQLFRAQKTAVDLAAEVEKTQDELRFLAERFGMVTQTGVVACPLRPITGQRLQSGAAVLYILGGGKQWYLKAVGLPAAAPGQAYELWFMTERGPVSGGRFTAESPERAELVSSQMPGLVTGVLITLEPASGSPTPSGEQVLFGNDKMQLL